MDGELGHVHTMPVHFEHGKNVTAAKFEPAFTRLRKNLKTAGNLTVGNSVQSFNAREIYLHPPKNRSVLFQKRRRMFCSHHFRVFTRTVSKICRLGFHFQHLPFSKSVGKNIPFSCQREAYPSHFLLFSKCAGIV